MPDNADPQPLAELFDVERIDLGLYRAHGYSDGRSVPHGRLAAQALVACGDTVESGRIPHSLHGYYLRRGDTREPVMFRVESDRDDSRYSARRVVALQDGYAICTISASFTVDVDSAEAVGTRSGPASPPGRLCEEPTHPSVEVSDEQLPPPHPRRVRLRPTGLSTAADPVRSAALITYFSDVSSMVHRGRLGEALDVGLDHSVWFHRCPRQLTSPLTVEISPGVAMGRRTWYSGTITDENRRVVARLAQEVECRGAVGSESGR